MTQPADLLNVLNYTWSDLERDLVGIKDKLNFELECVVAVAPRGLVLATIISYRLNLPMFVLDPERILGFDIPQANILLIDAVADSEFSKTLARLTSLQSFIINTLAIHEQAFCPDISLSPPLPYTVWVNYPWEQCNV